jgi:2-polyprenyl-3-methyl-5-hydroxy-6-metoxy-1,4-benzoquinol methylase
VNQARSDRGANCHPATTDNLANQPVLVHETQLCPTCGADDHRETELGDGKMLYRCSRCETVFAPAYADPAEIYRDGYLKGELGAFGLDLSHPLFQEYLAAVALRRFAILERAVPETGELLDVGCGDGGFLAVGRERGWTVHGLDPLPDSAAVAREQRGLDVMTGTLSDYGAAEPRFDVVSALHVLEHISSAHEFLTALAAWVRPGGHVMIEVPNYASVARKRRMANWSGYRPLEHVSHFTPVTLQRAFRRAGLQPVRTLTPTYVGPPQSLAHALADLELTGPLWSLALEPTCTKGELAGLPALIPGRLTWTALGAVARAYALRGAGAVVVGIARVL